MLVLNLSVCVQYIPQLLEDFVNCSGAAIFLK